MHFFVHAFSQPIVYYEPFMSNISLQGILKSFCLSKQKRFYTLTSCCQAAFYQKCFTPRASLLIQKPAVYYCIKNNYTIKPNAIFSTISWLYFWPNKTFRTHICAEIISSTTQSFCLFSVFSVSSFLFSSSLHTTPWERCVKNHIFSTFFPEVSLAGAHSAAICVFHTALTHRGTDRRCRPTSLKLLPSPRRLAGPSLSLLPSPPFRSFHLAPLTPATKSHC